MALERIMQGETFDPRQFDVILRSFRTLAINWPLTVFLGLGVSKQRVRCMRVRPRQAKVISNFKCQN